MNNPDPRDRLRVINSVAPIRICDNGGWTDTWFAGEGKVFNIAVSPFVEVQMVVREHAGGPERITIHAEDYGERYTIAEPNGRYTRHPLLEAAMEGHPTASMRVRIRVVVLDDRTELTRVLDELVSRVNVRSRWEGKEASGHEHHGGCAAKKATCDSEATRADPAITVSRRTPHSCLHGALVY